MKNTEHSISLHDASQSVLVLGGMGTGRPGVLTNKQRFIASLQTHQAHQDKSDPFWGATMDHLAKSLLDTLPDSANPPAIKATLTREYAQQHVLGFAALPEKTTHTIMLLLNAVHAETYPVAA